ACGVPQNKATLSGEVKVLNPEQLLVRKEAWRMDWYCHMCMVAEEGAYRDAGIKKASLDIDRFGGMMGSGIGGLITIDEQHCKLLEKGPGSVSPFFIPMAIGNMLAGNIAIKFKARGVCTSIVTACATATHSIGESFRKIRNGEA